MGSQIVRVSGAHTRKNVSTCDPGFMCILDKVRVSSRAPCLVPCPLSLVPWVSGPIIIMGFHMLTCLGARTAPAKDSQADNNMSPPLPKWRPRRTLIDLYIEKDKTSWYWRAAATFSAFLIMLGYVVTDLLCSICIDTLQLPHPRPRFSDNPFRDSLHQAVRHRGHRNTHCWLHTLACYRPKLLQLGISARHSLRSVPYILPTRPHQCPLQPLYA